MNYTYTDELYHHGIQGMKWGQRRFQNKDGSLTPAGRERYSDGSEKTRRSLKGTAHRTLAKVYALNERTYSKSNKTLASMNRVAKEEQLRKADEADRQAAAKRAARSASKKVENDVKNSPEYKAERNEKIKKAMIGAAVVGGVALAAYGGYKFNQSRKEYKTLMSTGQRYFDNAAMEKHLAFGSEVARKNVNAAYNKGTISRDSFAKLSEDYANAVSSHKRENYDNAMQAKKYKQAADATFYGRTIGRNKSYESYGYKTSVHSRLAGDNPGVSVHVERNDPSSYSTSKKKRRR